jgi:Sortase domain
VLRTKKRRAGAVVAAVLVVALAVVLAVVLRGPTKEVTAAGIVISKTTPAPTPTPTPTKPSTPHDFVKPAAPTAFTLTGHAFTIRANVCEMDYVLPLDPPGDQFHTVCWVREKFGVAPGSATKGTSYILGHSWAEAQLVFNPLSEYTMAHIDLAHPAKEGQTQIYPFKGINGYHVVLTLPTGTLTYVVDRTFAVHKLDAIDVPSLMKATTPNRVVLITCAVQGGADADYNIVVYAHLAASVAKRHA